MKKYFSIFDKSLQTAIEYRVEGFIWFLTEIVPTLVILFFWSAAFRTKTTISGYNLASMTAYYFGVMAIQVLATPHPEDSMTRDIQDGTLNFYLIKPLEIVSMRFLGEVAWKVVRLFFLAPFFFLTFAIFDFSFADINFPQVGLFSLGLVVSFVLQYLIKLAISFVSFWVVDPWGIFSFFDLLVMLFSGILIPLDLLPVSIQTLANILPFKFFYFFPLTILLGKIAGARLYFSLLLQFFWIILSLISLLIIKKRGLRSYAAFGG